MLQSKVCTKCGRRKPLADFTPSNTAKDECQSWCKECCNRMKREVRAGIYQYQQKEVLPRGFKRCSACNTVKPKQDFGLRKGAKDGLRGECNNCRAAYRAMHPEEIAEGKRRWRRANREKARATRHHWRQENRDKTTEYRRRWAQKNPKNAAERARRHRALKFNAEGFHESDEFLILCELAGWKCLRCGKLHKNSPLTEDHIQPLSRGGSDGASNLQPLCVHCNCVKGVKNTNYWQDPWWVCCT